MKIVLYHDWVPYVGGIETVLYNLIKELDKKGYEVTLVARDYQRWGTIVKYSKHCNFQLLSEGLIKCDISVLVSNHRLPKEIKYEKVVQWVHSDYEKYRLELYNEGMIDGYVAVSEHCAKVFRGLYGKECGVIYNLVDKDMGKDKSRVLKLITVSRVSPEKGFGRMLELARCLKEKNVKFIWTVLGDNSAFPREYYGWVDKFQEIEEVCFVGFKYNVELFVKDCDYLVQLSDWEGCPLSVLEALQMEVPCIVSDWGGVNEIIKDGKNGYILPMETSEYCGYVDKIVDKIPEVKFKSLSTVNDWVKLFENL